MYSIFHTRAYGHVQSSWMLGVTAVYLITARRHYYSVRPPRRLRAPHRSFGRTVKAEAHFLTPTFVLHIDKHNLCVTFCPQSAASLRPRSRSPVTLASPGLPRPPTSKQCRSLPPHRPPPSPPNIHSSFSGSIPFVTNY